MSSLHMLILRPLMNNMILGFAVMSRWTRGFGKRVAKMVNATSIVDATKDDLRSRVSDQDRVRQRYVRERLIPASRSVGLKGRRLRLG